jgi:hypothetical protein
LHRCALALPLLLGACTHHVVRIENPELPRTEREAILVLPGFVGRFQGTAAQEEYFTGRGYDVLIPDTIERESLEACLAAFEEFAQKHRLGEYRRVHVLAYIVGGWVLNRYVAAHPDHNIASVVYDRSPLQERAPAVLVREMPLITSLLLGDVIEDMAATSYEPLEKGSIRVGILIESKATPLIRRYRKTALSLGPLAWDPAALGQPCDDFAYTWLNHDQMYSRFDVIGPEILRFFRLGRFTSAQRRTPWNWDPFAPLPD